LARGALADEEDDEDVRLCTTEGLMRTGCDPPEERDALAFAAGTPLLLPLKRCQPPDCAAEPAAGAAARLTPLAGADGLLWGKPALGPPDAEDPLLASGREVEAERVMAWRCWSNDT
jgi:hypothetical protein